MGFATLRFALPILQLPKEICGQTLPMNTTEAAPGSSEIILLNSLEEVHGAMLALLAATQRSLHLYTPHLDPRLYNDSQVLDTIRAQVSRQPRLRFYLLLPPAARWRSDCPQLLQLAERLTSALSLRTLAPEEARERQEFLQSFAIADQRSLLHQPDPRHFVGSYTASGSGKARELFNFFMEIWEKAAPDPELRRLHL